MAEITPKSADALMVAISALHSIANDLTILPARTEAQIALAQIGTLLQPQQAEGNVVHFSRR